MAEPDPDPAPPSPSGGIPQPSRPGADTSSPSASQYLPELPYAEELQALLEGRYVVESFLGQGGMGAVYRGLQMPLRRPVAIKILQKQGEKGDFDFEERFKREAYAMASLTHPNIVQVYDCGDAGESFLFISMELVEGGDLSDAIKAGTVSPELALKLIPQICDGLQAAHERGIVHRDIKPANIFLTADGRAKVADFGLAKKFDVKSTFVTKAGLGMGTPDYAAPEQFEGVADIDHRADIYSLGVMFYQMLTGKLPRGIWQKPSKLKSMDPRLDPIVSRAMEQDRIERYQSIAEMKADIMECRAMPADATGVMPTGAVTPAERPMTTLTGKAPSAPPRTGNIPSSPSPTRTGNVPSSPSPTSTRTGNVPAAPMNTGKVPAFVRPTAKSPARTGAVGAAPLPVQITPEEAPAKSHTGIMIGIGAAIAVAVGAFFVLKPKPEPPPATPPSEPSKSYASTSTSTYTPTPKASPSPSSTSQPSTPAPRPALPPVSSTLVTLSPAASSPAGPASSVLTFGGHRYQALPDLLTWTGAKVRAEQVGGHLATITTKEEDDWIRATFIEKLDGVGLWIGATNDGIPRQWRWVTGEPFNFIGWVPGEPSNRPDEPAVSFIHHEKSGVGWIDLKDSGLGIRDRRGGLLVEWDDASTPIKMPLAAASSAPGAINLFEGLDTKRDSIEGDWVMKDGELNCDRGNGFAHLAFNVPVPQEYDFHICFTRKTGARGVSQHIVLPEGRDLMWIMGGFSSDAFGWEMINGRGGSNNPTTIKASLETGRRYDCLVKVRKSRLQVELDGKIISDYEMGSDKFDVFEKWSFPDPKKIGIGCQVPTVFHTVELIPFTGETVVATPSAPSMPAVSSPTASVPPVPSPTTPDPTTPLPPPSSSGPAAPPADPRVAQLQAGFKARYESDVQKPYDTSVNSLNQSYAANGIPRARSAAQQKGALDEVTALDAEKTRVSSNAPLPPTDEDTLPASLKALRVTYRTALGKIEADRAKAAAPLYDLYLGALDSYIAELTKGTKTDDAQKVQAFRDEVAAQKSAVMEPSSSSPNAVASTPVSPAPSAPGRSTQKQSTVSSSGSGSPLPIPPEALAPPKKAEHSRELAEWAVVKSRGRIFTGEGPQTKRYIVPNPDTPLSPDDLPKGNFNITLLDSGNTSRAPLDTNWVEGETGLEELTLMQVDFASPLALRGMKKLNILRIRGSASVLPDDQMLLWPPLPTLKQVDIQGAFGNTGLRVLCERCPEITRLTIHARLTEGGLAPLQRLKNLNYFEVADGTLPAGELGVLTNMPKLDKITFNSIALSGVDFSPLVNVVDLGVFNGRLTDAEVKSVGTLNKLTSLRLGGNQITDASLAAIGSLQKLQNLELPSNPITGASFASLGGLKNLTRIMLIATKISDATLATLPPMPALVEVRIQGNAAIGDGAAAALGKHRSIAKLDVGNTGMGDEGLQALCNELPNLTELELYNTKVTDAALAALKRLKKIEHLDFADTALTDAAVEHLKKLTTLKFLQIRNTGISAKSVAELKRALPQCQIIAN